MPRPSNHCSACADGQAAFPFTMAFQPIVDLEETRIDAHEALVRGCAGEGAAHVLAQVNDDNRYAFDQSCRVRAIELAARLGLDRRLNINFLPNAVYEPKACIRLTLDAARRTGFPLDRLTFEIIEHEAIANTAHLKSIVGEYRRHGFKIALDDFGTAHSSLQRLAEIKPDIVKIDRALVADCDRDRTRSAIVASIVGLGAALKMKVVAEGAERADEVATLRAVGVRFVQGYYFSRPQFEALASEHDVFAPATVAAAVGVTA